MPNHPNIIGIIPARYESSRLAGKMLADICGKPLIQRVWENAVKATTLRRVIIATDDYRIANVCDAIGAEYLITPPKIQSGTDRIAFAYEYFMDYADIIVNIQGDEPLIEPEIIDKLCTAFCNSDADVGTLVKRIDSDKDLEDDSVVKVVLKADGTALYFSRHPVPFVRDTNKKKWLQSQLFWKHIGVYAYTREALMQFVELPVSPLELTEKLEQLRLMEQGAKYLCVETKSDLIGVDTPEDLERVRKIICG